MSEFFPEIVPSTEDEHIARMLLLIGLHNVYKASVETDDDSLEAAVKARQAGMSMESDVFVSPQFREHEALPATSYDQMVWAPKTDEDVYNLKQIVARLPMPAPSFDEGTESVLLNEPSTIPAWNDIFIEVAYKDGTLQRALLNSKGIMPYRNRSDVQEIEQEEKDGDRRGPTDGFAVSVLHEELLPVSAAELTLLIRSCNLQRQTVEN